MRARAVRVPAVPARRMRPTRVTAPGMWSWTRKEHKKASTKTHASSGTETNAQSSDETQKEKRDRGRWLRVLTEAVTCPSVGNRRVCSSAVSTMVAVKHHVRLCQGNIPRRHLPHHMAVGPHNRGDKT